MNANGRVVTSLAMVLIFTAFVLWAFTFRREAALMPLLAGVPGLVLSVIQLITELRTRASNGDAPPLLQLGELSIILWIAGFTLGVIAFGFVLGAPLLLAAYLYFVSAERLAVAVAGGLSCLAVMEGLERLLHIPLFEGLVLHYLV